MKSSDLENLVQKAKEKLLTLEAGARDAERKAKAATGMNRQAKLKLKQAKKLAKFSKKQAKKAGKEVLIAQQLFQAAGIELQKVETKFSKQLKKARAKNGRPQVELAKTSQKKSPKVGAARQVKPAATQKPRPSIKIVQKVEPALLRVAASKSSVPATAPNSPMPSGPTS